MLELNRGDGAARHNAKPLAIWLFCCAGMVLAMMVIGAITRLTESGLSIVEWRPLIGALPPFSEAEWNRVFSLYRNTSEYKIDNAGMSLAAFKTIFWWEYIHRLWGRAIGLVFAVPFLIFLVKGMIPRGMKRHLVALFLLGGIQAVIGWWMVKSGFVARTDVSQYRLAIHLGMAFVILGYLLWMALDISAPGKTMPEGPRNLAFATLAIVFITAVAGGLVAGLNAGFDYNTWPLMDGGIVPEGILELSPWWLNGFENIATVQFNHRILAYLSLICIAGLWWRSRNADARTRTVVNVLGFVGAVQMGLGIATLLLTVPLPLAVLHQAGAALLFSLSLWAAQSLSGRDVRAKAASPADRRP